MPRWLRRFLGSKDLNSHFRIALIMAAVARVLSAWFVYGPQALDDYKHGVWPAYQVFAGQPLDLPEYRSWLLVWLLAGFVKLGSFVGVSSALAQVRTMYLGLGAISLSAVYGTYLFVRNSRSRHFAALSLYMIALYPLMPFLSTRAFGESVATAFVCLGFGILEDANVRTNSFARLCFGFLFLGVATLFRFHVGLLFVTYGILMLLRRNWRAVSAGLIMGVVIALLQGLIDYLSGKEFYGTLFAYLAENAGGAAKYGVSPWYNTWILMLGIAMVPFSLVFFKSLKGLWRRQYAILIPLLIYVLAHSLVAHKEERFLYPIVGLEIWALSYLWTANSLNKWSLRIFTPAFLGLGSILLLIGCLVNTQEGEIEPPAYAESHFEKVLYLDQESLFGESLIKFYFLRPPSLLQSVNKESLNANAIDEGLAHHPELNAIVLLTSRPETRDQLHALEQIKTMESRCGTMRTAGSPIDRLLYKMNPRHNERRRPTWYLICQRERG